MQKTNNLTIVFFYTYVVHYVIGVLKKLVEINDNINITLIYYDKKNIERTQYIVEEFNRIKIIKRSKLNKKSLLELLLNQKPHIIYISGWVDDEYIYALKKYKKIYKNKTVSVVGIDDQWFGTIRQRLGVFYYKVFYKSIFDYMWIAGKPQFSYAQHFGYSSKNIIYNLYSADDSIFTYSGNFKKRFLFVGRFVKEKGIFTLLNAYKSLDKNIRNSWPLYLIGDGPLYEEILKFKDENVVILPFLQLTELKNEIDKGGVFCLPSNFEPWGVVVHEMCLSGYPLILSDKVGAATEFLIDGYNGYMFNFNSVTSLLSCMQKIVNLSNEEIEIFSKRSVYLGKRINTELSSKSLLSVLEKNTNN
ncbi:glycosyltransferase family 4 protein [Thermaurantimonas aggregans]|uniref:glycosyltransferase family 4 protein n=1 Tax=Thermaurantimonas aggregans TaxID=2173829 RepID=UPI0023F49343|nr:glycosyltransferase family 4 protein [Thermaurantimonas aggregans]MCX8148600.1 glycosyltransferase family 4 protein [Thermaurantimonas aggregans]